MSFILVCLGLNIYIYIITILLRFYFSGLKFVLFPVSCFVVVRYIYIFAYMYVYTYTYVFLYIYIFMYIHFVYIYFANLTTFTYTHTQKVLRTLLT